MATCVAAEPRLAPRTLSVELEDGVLLIQVLDLGKQTFVWLGFDEPRLGNLVAAVPTRYDRLPAVSSLLGPGDAASLAQRLALKTGRAFLVSANLPSSSPLLLALAEKHLLALLPHPTGQQLAASDSPP